MARIVYQDQTFTLPDAPLGGEELRKTLQVPEDHDLVLVRGQDNRLVSRGHQVRPVDGDYFMDAPVFKYGS